MKTLNKQPYPAPSVKSVSFTVESGFGDSQTEMKSVENNQLDDYSASTNTNASKDGSNFIDGDNPFAN